MSCAGALPLANNNWNVWWGTPTRTSDNNRIQRLLPEKKKKIVCKNKRIKRLDGEAGWPLFESAVEGMKTGLCGYVLIRPA